ncbi:hypothetical protein RRU94_16150 [Domibacillus sp. DTU_2020_1001157_1_SI_ALB_TIR_016]|uniref:hypothetical protein n=1 Tax=Domibacillus sp. DTU_2020_1001157_1_SI_ALB_TIR_016 TaxID=3077789 RepID=UPI0028E83B1E|nr:hypothetical protein [Domibacillus sp. DTU_2020_1001157_1_SI_ALB_TIR_016]WNS82268.1 hypothetical protein RRU94_16150 [Domibacillus sp. DTU_2020_1001157_1_SI_ALB_TIR_016]
MREWWTAVFSIVAVQTKVTEVFYGKCNCIYNKHMKEYADRIEAGELVEGFFDEF